MLTSEDRDVLGLPTETVRVRRPSAVSQVLKAINADFDRGLVDWNVSGDNGDPGFQIRVAADRATRRRAYALAHRVYSGRGYVSGEQQLILSRFDTHTSTLTLLAQDEQGGDAATISLVFDSDEGLPCDEIYRDELDSLRGQGRRLVEVTRLAISEENQRSKLLLVRLFNFIYIFARRVRGFDDFVIEVNPRHVTYYRRLLNFEQVGPERACLRVQGAPAVLLRCDLGMGEREIRRVGGQGARSDERTLYPYFYSWLEEGAVAQFLATSHKPMTRDDARYFGLTAPAKIETLAV